MGSSIWNAGCSGWGAWGCAHRIRDLNYGRNNKSNRKMSYLIENTLRMSFLKCEQTISHSWYRNKSVTASGALSGPQTSSLAYRVMFQQTKVHEKTRPLIVSDKERENCICQNVQNLSYWNRYFVIYPHKCTLNHLKKKYQEKWENAYVTVKDTRASRALRWALDPHQYWLTSLARLCFATTSAKSWKKFLGPPLTKSWIR